MAEIDLGRVVGEKGEPGQQGPKGNTGAAGPQGPPGVDSTRTEEILEMLGGLGFGQDSEGKWGYIPPGADTVVPFSEGGSLPDNVRIIELQAVPLAGGTVNGGGMVSDGMTITIEAQPDEENNFIFEGWKESGAIICEELQYTFPVSADRSLTAEFSEAQYILGVDWWETTLPLSKYWTSVAYGNGRFVAVADNSNSTAYSIDGVTWMEATLPLFVTWTSVAYGNGKFVAIAYGNKAAYSADGITWTVATLPLSQNWKSVVYGNGKFVAVASDNRNKAAYSADGITWTVATLPLSVTWTSVAYGNGKFVQLPTPIIRRHTAQTELHGRWQRCRYLRSGCQ